MARHRTIKPEWFTDSKSGKLTGDETKFLFGLLVHGDDYGVIKYDIDEFKVHIFPYDSRILANVIEDSLLPALTSRGLVKEFEVSGRKFLHIVNFYPHQKVDHPSLPILKGWTKTTTVESYQQFISENVELTQSDSAYIKDSIATPLDPSRILAPDLIRLDSKELSSNNGKEKNVEITPSVEWDRPQPSQRALEGSEKKPDYRQAIRERVWPSYLELTNRSESSYSWTPLRAAKAEARLKEFLKKTDGDLDKALAMMLRVVEAIGKSDFHMGRDVKSNGKRYVEWEDHLWRSQEQAEKWLAEAKPVARSGLSSGLPDVVEETMRQRKEPTVYDPEFEKGFQSFKAAAGKFGGSK